MLTKADNMYMSDRIQWIDILKGIGIILVVFGHTCDNDMYIKWVYSFHMALFFVASGMLFSTYDNATTFFRKKIKSLVIPYMIGGMASYAAYQGLYLVTGRVSLSELFSMLYIAQEALLRGNYNDLTFNPALWFIPCLFMTECILYLIVILFRRKKGVFFVCLYLATNSSLRLLPNIEVWDIKEAFTWIFWLGLGYSMKDRVKKISEIKRHFLYIIVIIGMVLSFVCAQTFDNIGKSSCISFLGVAAIVSISILLSHSWGGVFLAFCGQSSLMILIVHLYLLKEISKLLGDKNVLVQQNLIYSIGITFFVVMSILLIRFCYIKVKFCFSKRESRMDIL